MNLLGILYGSLVGISLGLTGAGGSIITIPILVYLLGMDVHDATGASLLVVGVGGLSGTIQYFIKHLVHWRTAILFALAGALGAFAGSYLNVLAPSKVILYLFAAVMLLIAILMMRRKSDNQTQERPNLKELLECGWHEWFAILGSGLLVGFMTGFFGVGGGFLIVPTLIIVLKFPIRDAIATSLLVISINCLWGILARVVGIGSIDFGPALMVTIGAIIGIIIGDLIALKISSSSLTKGFAYFVLAIAIYMFLRTANIL